MDYLSQYLTPENRQRLWLTGFILALTTVIMVLTKFTLTIVLSCIFSYVMFPLQRLLMRKNLSRRLSAWITFSCFVLMLSFILLWLIPLLIFQVIRLFDVLPQIVGQLMSEDSVQKYLGQNYNFDQIKDLVAVYKKELITFSTNFVYLSYNTVSNLTTCLLDLLFMTLLVYFILVDRHLFVDAFKETFSLSSIPIISKFWHYLNQELEGYVIGKLYEVIIITIASIIGFKLLNLNFFALLGVLVGLAQILPIIGPLVMTAPIVLIALWQFGWDHSVTAVLGFYTVLMTIDSNLLLPLLLSNKLNMHPALVLVSMLFFGSIFGLWGLLLAVPIVSVVRIYIRLLKEP